MNAKKKLAALVINWNGAGDTLELLHSLCRCQSELISITAIVIDNASTSDDRTELNAGLCTLQNKMQIVLRANTANIGVPAAYNQAIQIAGLDYDYYLRLDNDVIVEPSGLEQMITALDAGNSRAIGIVGGNIKYFDRKDEDNGGAVAIDLVRGKTTVTYPAFDLLCDGVLGCIMLLSGDLVRLYAPEVFDSALFLCTDESELSLRAARDGMKTIYVATLIGFHKSGRSTGKVSFVSNYYSARNWTLLRLKYTPTRQQRLSVLLRLPVDVGRSLISRRWAFPLGVTTGLGLSVGAFFERRIRYGHC